MDSAAKEILSDLRKKNYAPVYVLQGEESYYIDLISRQIEASVLSENERSFNQVVIYGKDAPMHVILTHAKRFPMMAERQVVIVREAQDIPDLNKESGSKLLLDYISNPVPSTLLVLCHKHKTFDKRRELGKKIEKLTKCATFKKPYESQLPAFVTEYVKSKGLAIDDSGVRVFCEYIGNDLNRLANEIDKLSISLAAGERITGEKAMQQVGVSREYNIFELQRALISRDIVTANKIVNYFEANTKKNPLIPVVAYLYSFFSKLLVASSLPDKSERAMVSALKISPFAAKDYSRALQIYHERALVGAVAAIAWADLQLKGVDSGARTEGQILRELVYKLLHP
ncbi:MAG: DNA polymerase III subunit delta [Cyclobacteriaceae bacterium]